MSYAPFAIKDGPTFEHRNLNLDIGRTWIQPSEVLRTMGTVALEKFEQAAYATY